MLTSEENNETLENLNQKFLENLNDKGILASYLLSPLSEITNAEHTNQFKLVKILAQTGQPFVNKQNKTSNFV